MKYRIIRPAGDIDVYHVQYQTRFKTWETCKYVPVDLIGWPSDKFIELPFRSIERAEAFIAEEREKDAQSAASYRNTSEVIKVFE